MLYQKYSLRLEGRITNKEKLSSHDLEVLFYASYMAVFPAKNSIRHFAAVLLFVCLYDLSFHLCTSPQLCICIIITCVLFFCLQTSLSRRLSFSPSFLPYSLFLIFPFFPLLSFQSHFLIAPWIGFIRACSIVRYTSSSFLHGLPSPLLLSNFVLVFNFLHFSVQSSV